MLKQLLSNLCLLLLLGANLPALGQKENSNWYFGTNAAVSFPAAGVPVAVRGSAMNTYEACASVSDATGRLLFYTNSETIWNRNHQVMVNGTNLGGHASCSQGTLVVQNQANAQQYYVFVLDAAENQLVGGLKYNLVDMTRQGGLGEIIQSRVQVSSVRLTEKLTTVPHANGHDTWVLVHGWQTNIFYAYLLTATGLQPTPVTTTIGAIHSGGGGTYSNANAVGYMRLSPDGSKLALGIRDQNFELFDFNTSTGQLSNYVPLVSVYRSYGVQFSPDNHLLYGTNLDGLGVFQYDLQAGSASAIANSGQTIAYTSNNAGAIQTGPDGKLYVSIFNSPYLAVIDNPNVRGTGCGFRPNGVYLNGSTGQIGLPNYPSSQVAALVPALIPTPPPVVQAITIPNIITPNGDPQNEFFTLKGLTPSDWRLNIFDRWGKQVYEKARYDNSWDATGQASGVYYYMLSNEATGERYRGWVEVQRGS
jgi:gliding motility-associated-like protein